MMEGQKNDGSVRAIIVEATLEFQWSGVCCLGITAGVSVYIKVVCNIVTDLL